MTGLLTTSQALLCRENSLALFAFVIIFVRAKGSGHVDTYLHGPIRHSCVYCGPHVRTCVCCPHKHCNAPV